jgi:DNA polymerase (family 10)
MVISNIEIATRLQDYARQLRKRRENLYRIRAYRIAAETVMRLDRTVEDIVHERGRGALAELPGIGTHIADTITAFLTTGEWTARH